MSDHHGLVKFMVMMDTQPMTGGGKSRGGPPYIEGVGTLTNNNGIAVISSVNVNYHDAGKNLPYEAFFQDGKG